METVHNDRSVVKNLILGFQHLLAMYSGDILVPLLIGGALHFSAAQMTYLVSMDIFMCGNFFLNHCAARNAAYKFPGKGTEISTNVGWTSIILCSRISSRM